MSAPPYIPFFVEDYIGATTELSIDEHGAYFLLMLSAWKHPSCTLPDDDRKLARICRVTPHKWKQIRETMLDFWTIKDGRWENKRLLKERAFVEKRSEQAREKANTRWEKQNTENKGNASCSSNAAADAEGDAPYTPHIEDTDVSSPPVSPAGRSASPKMPKPDGVADDTWADFKRQRKRPLTDTALKGLKREADKAGWTLEQALTEATERGWQGFKAEWVQDKSQGNRNDRSNQQSPRNGARAPDGFERAVDSRLGIGDAPEDARPAHRRAADDGYGNRGLPFARAAGER